MPFILGFCALSAKTRSSLLRDREGGYAVACWKVSQERLGLARLPMEGIGRQGLPGQG